ncbi:YihY family inner membrane protein [Pontibacillus yanchengensis]|uniref:YihY family inner membrane protein n=2 Tax=Pontibacillus yanchengensis TaxID=462910 RepID=A0ACC7VBX9_9BACI|nr:YihY/virulence factor BrkB family protein [Pontibacillus yanchengensis]MYL35185.1 YihY family inner membrane protein [Pontibacillus yanchengensis]MYL52448.1 YihY family inner membrane protein [Pontibacillus yanchengensis]
MIKVIQFNRQLIKRLNQDDVVGLSAQLSYFFLLSLFPFLFFLVTLIGYVNISEQKVMGIVQSYAPEGAYEIIHSNLQELMNNQNGGLLSFGVIATLWAASNGINALIKALDRAYQVQEKRHFIIQRMLSVWLMFAMIFIILLSLLLPVFGTLIGDFLFSTFGFSETFLSLWHLLRWAISSILFFVTLLFLYTLVPNRPIRFKEAWIGACFATVGWQIVSLLFSMYVNRWGGFSATYGSLGGVIVIMIWFYITGIILITGGEINALLRERIVTERKLGEYIRG